MDYPEKALDHIADYFWQWDRPADLARHLPAALALAARLARPPFRRGSEVTGALAALLESASEPLREPLLAAPDRQFRRLEAACRLRNNAGLIADGLVALADALGSFAARCFVAAPERLFRAAKALGSLNAPLRAEVLRQVGPPPLDESDLVAALEKVGHLVWQQITGDDAALIEREEARHALQLAHAGRVHRRALRRLLRASLAGQGGYLLEHPLTRAWLRRHPDLPVGRWLAGIPFNGHAPASGPLRLAVEQDPLEALKLGTYVGSCLGLGGMLAATTPAAVLDINKRVLYARNRRGSVIARQLLAIAEDGRLVCFSVYPEHSEPGVKELFRAHDAAFARALGVDLHPGGPDDEYVVAAILSHDWWDDGAWDGSVEPA